MTTIDEDALYEQLRHLPDFDCLPLPSHWFKKYNIPPVTQPTTREFIESQHTIKCSVAPKDLPPIIINEPQQGGKLIPIAPPEDIKVQTISRPITDMNYTVHPSLLEEVIIPETASSPPDSQDDCTPPAALEHHQDES
jgi:hypothetical protein